MRYLSLFSGIGGFELGIQQAYDSKSSRMARKQEYNSRAPRGQEEVNVRGAGLPQGNGDLHDNIRSQTSEDNPVCIGFSEIDKYATAIYQSHFPEHKNYGDITKINETELPEFDMLVGGFPCQSFSIAGKRGGFADTRGTLFFDIARILKHKQPRLFLLENVKGLLSHDEGRTFATIIATLDELGYDLQWQVLNSKNFGVPQSRERVFIVGHLRGTSRPKVFPAFGTDNKNIKVTGTGGGVMTKIELEPAQVRRLTPTECERLQGFPDGWTEEVSDTQRYKCLGNAVTVNVIQAIVNELV